MRFANYCFSIASLVLGLVFILFLLMQGSTGGGGMWIGWVLVLNGVVRLWFARWG